MPINRFVLNIAAKYVIIRSNYNERVCAVIYLESFSFAKASQEEKFILNFPYLLEMQCYSHDNVYPFKIFPQKCFERAVFEPITVFYGRNGSGKSTVLNVIAEKLGILGSSPFNKTPYMREYLKLCGYELAYNVERVPQNSRKITSDDVFDFLLDIRAINQGVDRQREALFDEYYQTVKVDNAPLESLDGLSELKRRNEARAVTKSKYVSRRLPRELDGKSNGESAYEYFTRKIEENAIYILDEPENSLSAELQIRLAQFLEDSARFYNCQFIISTHSPFLLSMKSAKIYDLDATPVKATPWTQLENVRVYYEFFKQNEHRFK